MKSGGKVEVQWFSGSGKGGQHRNKHQNRREPMKLICGPRGCGWRGTEDKLLRAPNPFIDGEEMVACPNCRDHEALEEACDQPDCWVHTCCGVPTPAGYRRVCSKHYREISDKLAAAEPRNTGPDHDDE